MSAAPVIRSAFSDAARVDFHLARLDRMGPTASPAIAAARLQIAQAAARGVRRGRMGRQGLIGVLRRIARMFGPNG